MHIPTSVVAQKPTFSLNLAEVWKITGPILSSTDLSKRIGSKRQPTFITDVAIQNGVTGILVEPDDIGAYVDGIQRLLKLECWQEYSKAGIEYTLQNFSLSEIVAQYQTLFKVTT